MSDSAKSEIYVVLIWVNPGQIETLHEYERLAEPLIRRHGGSFKVVMRVTAAAENDGFDRSPDEVHVLEFASSDAFDRYRADPDCTAIAHLRDASVERVIFIRGEPVALFT